MRFLVIMFFWKQFITQTITLTAEDQENLQVTSHGHHESTDCLVLAWAKVTSAQFFFLYIRNKILFSESSGLLAYGRSWYFKLFSISSKTMQWQYEEIESGKKPSWISHSVKENSKTYQNGIVYRSWIPEPAAHYWLRSSQNDNWV